MSTSVNETCSTGLGGTLGLDKSTILMSLVRMIPILGSLIGSNQTSSDGGLSSIFATGLLLLLTNYSLPYFLYYILYVWECIKGRLWFSLVIKSEDEIFQWILEYINNSHLSKRASILSAHSAWNTNTQSAMPAFLNRKVNPFSDSQETKRPLLYFMPYYGNWFFCFNSWPIFISRYKLQDSFRSMNYQGMNSNNVVKIQNEIVRISTFGIFPNRTIRFLKGIIKNIMDKSYTKNENKTWIYSPEAGRIYDMVWKRTQARSVRSFDSVVLEGTIKEEIKEDVELFLKSKEWYQSRGIPYRRGFCLHGPPGTGKSSYITALAGQLKMSIAILSLNMSSMDDTKLAKLIDDSPRNSLLVIEDVDVALQKKKRGGIGPFRGSLTLSGLLNALDGIATAEGRILFMTTNHIKKLSTALLRPGRVDMKVFFGYSSRAQIEGLWNNFYCKDPKTRCRMLEIGKELGKMIPEGFVTCAELQGFFLLHRFKEEKILEDVERFVEEIKNEREKEKKEEEDEKKRVIEEKKKELERMQKQIEKGMEGLEQFKKEAGIVGEEGEEKKVNMMNFPPTVMPGGGGGGGMRNMGDIFKAMMPQGMTYPKNMKDMLSNIPPTMREVPPRRTDPNKMQQPPEQPMKKKE